VPKLKLTKRAIDSAKPEPGKDLTLMDTELRNFGVRIRGGSKTFFIRYRSKGRHRRFKVGLYGKELTLQQARVKAQRLLADISSGADPAGEAAATRKKPKVAELCERYLTEHAEPKKKPRSVHEDRRQINSYILPAIGRLQVDAVTRTDVSRLHNSMKKKPYQANRTLALISKVFHLAEIWGLRPQNSNPAYGVTKFREEARKRYLNEQELAKLGSVLNESTEHPCVVAGIKLLLFTGCRLDEIRTLRWADVDRENASITLEDTKTGYRVIPLNESALAVLAGLCRQAGNPYVLPGSLPGKPWADLAKPWRRIRKAAGLDGVRVHDLRHTAASFGVNLGMSLPVVGHLLGHKETKTTARYSHLALDPVRQASEDISRALQKAMDKEPDHAQVIDFPKKVGE
jgi:integrase